MRFALALALLAGPALARDPILSLPIACTLGQDCYIQNHFDHDGGPGAADFTCGPQAYDGHDGTDFALLSDAQMQAGVDVLAVAPGTVTATRDGMPDIAQGTEGAPDVTDRECGNGVVIDHGGGWVTQYCHLKRDSVTVGKGRRVGAGTVLGKVGLSGQTEFPHVHFAIRRDGSDIDPFLPDGIVRCSGPPETTLWRDPLAYVPGGLIELGLADRVPDYGEVTAGTAALPRLRTDQPALVVWGSAFGVRAGDVMRLQLDGPGGMILDETVTLDRTQARLFRAVGRKTGVSWPSGEYRATVTLLRDGTELDRRDIAVPMD